MPSWEIVTTSGDVHGIVLYSNEPHAHILCAARFKALTGRALLGSESDKQMQVTVPVQKLKQQAL